MSLCIFHSFASSTAELPADGAENTNMCETAQAHALLEKKMVSAETRHEPKTSQPSSLTVDNCNRL